MLKNIKEFKLPEIEEKILEFWRKNNIFQKSVAQRKGAPIFNFFEGPPTANGRPGLHHILARSFKDIIPRYKTMKGFYVPRRGGWDTHGLPVEIGVEKALGLKSKKDIEKYGIAEFNRKCKESVWEFKEDWEKVTERMGFWVDLKNPYITYEKTYIESLWWILSEAWKKKLLYRGHKVVPWCTRCGTGLSSHELAQGYKETTDDAVYVRFKLKKGQRIAKGFSADPKTFILSWTTALLALPGNVALAVDEKVKYIALEHEGAKHTERWIIAKDIYDKPKNFFKDWAKPILGKNGEPIVFAGKNLVGLRYDALWSIRQLKNSKSHKVYAADFVTTTDGTGVVQINPMYGEDDYKLAKKVGLPQHHTIDQFGAFTKEVAKFDGMYVKSKETEAKILKYLEANNILVKKEPYAHEYPFCWRCQTALLYYARDSWFISMSKLREKLVALNKKIHWIPEHIKTGRFGEWIKEAKDWAISRERYWATPLPIWVCKRGHTKVMGSIADLENAIKPENNFFVMRHGAADHNIKGLIASGPETEHHASNLTEEGIEAVKNQAQLLKKEGIDFIFTSPYKRAKETARIISKATKAKIIEDKRLAEINTGIFNWKTIKEYDSFFDDPLERFTKAPALGESLNDLRKRVFSFVDEVNRQYSGKNILIVGHGDPLWMIEAALKNCSPEQAMKMKSGYIKLGEFKKIEFKNISYNEEGDIDLHRPYVDQLNVVCSHCPPRSKSKMERVKEVADAWFDSGAMPYAAPHYPFEHKEDLDKHGIGYPADYISEGMDQTRGWFYTMLAVAVILGRKEPYKNVISLGLIHDKFGQKMSKSRGNTVDPWAIMQKYGVDVIRWYFYTVNPPGEAKNFDEDDLVKVSRRFFSILYNSYVFSNTVPHHSEASKPDPRHVLDHWILSRLNETIKNVTESIEDYEIGDAARIIEALVDDLSRWYIRRSRDRDDMIKTLLYVLGEISKLIAPFAPFFADALYQSLGNSAANLRKFGSVHLDSYPVFNEEFYDKSLIKKMAEVRRLSALGLAERASHGIKVRQPLKALILKDNPLGLDEELLGVLRDEINVKEIIVDKKVRLPEGKEVKLDVEITEELKQEGLIRELKRGIQDLRQELNLNPSDKVELYLELPEATMRVFLPTAESFRHGVGARVIYHKRTDKFTVEKEVDFDGNKVWIAIKI